MLSQNSIYYCSETLKQPRACYILYNPDHRIPGMPCNAEDAFVIRFRFRFTIYENLGNGAHLIKNVQPPNTLSPRADVIKPAAIFSVNVIGVRLGILSTVDAPAFTSP